MKFLILFIFLSVTLSGQNKVEVSEKRMRTVFLNAPQRALGKYYLFDGITSHQVELPKFNLSPVYKVAAGSGKLYLLKSPVAEFEELPEGAPSIIIPQGINDFYLLISNDPENKILPLRMNLVNTNYELFRSGEMLWYNLTEKTVLGALGKSKLRLPPKKSVIIAEPASKNGDYSVELYFRVPGDDRIHPLIESQWRYDVKSRHIVFVYNDGKRRAPKVKSFVDFREVEKQEGQ